MNFTLKKSDLNFKVYVAPTKPTAPGAENDIAIISSVPMSNWIMSPEKPSGIPRNDGDLWIQYSVTGNTKNILKQNAFMIFTISAWQYVDGAWVYRKAVSYQGGEWVEWITYLYNKGTLNDNFRVLTADDLKGTDFYSTQIVQPVFNTTDITISASRQIQTPHKSSELVAMMDVTPFKTLKCKLKSFSGTEQHSRLALLDNYGQVYGSAPKSSAFKSGVLEYSVDISDVTGEKILEIGFASFRGISDVNSSANIVIESVWLE